MAYVPKMDDDSSEGLELPLRDPERGPGSERSAYASDSEDDMKGRSSTDWIRLVLLDLPASVVFWYILLFAPLDTTFNIGMGAAAVLMLLWRIYRAYVGVDEQAAVIPYTVGYVSVSGKELYLVATLHISPRAPRDVEAVIDTVFPDIAMIELDEERLDHMRDVEIEEEQGPRPEDLQPIQITGAGVDPVTILAQRALWNAEKTGDLVSGTVYYSEGNAFGIQEWGPEVEGKVLLVRRGSPDGEFAPFALKAHMASEAGAQAVIVMSQENKLPLGRIGGGTIWGDLRVASSTCNCGFPSIPVLLVQQSEGERLRQLCEKKAFTNAEFEVLEDNYPRRTLRRRLCQGCALMFSGIGILYRIIECFSVEVGAEFMAAEIAAHRNNIPCVCVDVNLNRFWGRLGAAVLPTPCNIMSSLLAWLAFPRVFFQVLYPPRGNVDVIGSIFLHVASFPLRVWAAFFLAAYCASSVTSKILELIGMVGTEGAVETGVVKEEDRQAMQDWVMLGIEFYLFPQVYLAVAASRDEAMYRNIVQKSRERDSRRMVVVVGAGHANGILQCVRERGL